MPSDSSAAAGDVAYQTILDRMADGFFALDTDWRITYANDEGRTLLRTAMSENALADAGTVEGVCLWDAVPEAVNTEFYEKYHEAMNTQSPVEFEDYYEPLETWFEVRVFPSDSGLSVYLRDVTDRRQLKQRRQESLQALQELYAVSSDQDRSFEQKVEAMLSLGCEYLDLPNGFLTKVENNTQHVELSVATHPLLEAGESCPLDEAYCRRTIELDHLLTVVNAADEGWETDPAYDRFELGTYIGGRVMVGGELYGTLCFADEKTRGTAFTDTNRTFVELLTRWVSYELERQATNRELKRERDRFEEFANVVSHDLRNPLNTALGRVNLLAETTDSEHLPPIRRSLDRMQTLLDDLLSLAREGTTAAEPTTVDLATLARDAWTTTETADATLDVAVENSIRADESRLRQLLENLFRNAVEHGGRDVTVSVTGLPTGFAVADDGPGIPAGESAQVFELGYTTDDGGTGFGLSITAEIAAAHDWSIDVAESEHGGARFEITGVEHVDSSS